MGKQWDRGDYCTLAPDKVLGVDVSDICYRHDVNYMDQRVSRSVADRVFYEEMLLRLRDKRFGKILAGLYYFAVRVFGFVYW